MNYERRELNASPVPPNNQDPEHIKAAKEIVEVLISRFPAYFRAEAVTFIKDQILVSVEKECVMFQEEVDKRKTELDAAIKMLHT